jgi:O-antigen/teichoic acid export membrane protein
MSLSSRLILQKYVPLSEAGLYSLGQNIGMGMEVILVAFNKAWVPLLYSTADTEAPETFARLTKYYLTVITFVALALSTFAKEIIVLISTKSYYGSYEVIPIIVFGYIFIGIYMMLTNQIFYKKKTHYFLFITPVSAGISMLVPKFGMMGAATATMFSFVIFAGITYVFSMKIFPIPYEKKNFALLIILAVIVFTSLKFLAVYSLSLNVLIKFAGLLVFSAALWFSSFFSDVEKQEGINKFISLVRRIIPL